MTALLASWLADRYVVFTGWTLLVILWETTVVGLLLAGWRWWRIPAAARHQYNAAVVALSAALLLAAATPFVLFAWGGAPASPSVRAAALDSGPSFVPGHVVGSDRPVSTQERAASPIAAVSPDSIAGVAALLWAAGVLILAVRLTGGWLFARAIARRAQPVSSDPIRNAAARVAADQRLPYEVPLLQSADVEAPVVIGWRRPVLILPREAERLSPEMVAALLVHEFAHIRRRDYLVNLVQSAIELVLFFSPAVVWISRRIREAREFCCDDVAVARCGDARQYVQALTTLAALGTINTARPAMGAAGPRLITRVRRLLQEEAMPAFRSLRFVALSGALLVLVVTGIRVTGASAARAPRVTLPASPAAETVPFGYATEQHGSGVVLQNVVSTPEFPWSGVTVRNITSERVVALRFVAAVERFQSPGLPVRLFTSDEIAVSIAPGNTASVSPNVPTAAQLQEVAAESGNARLQSFFGVQEVRFANGHRWSITPNSAARTGPDALNIPRLIYPRDLILRDADRAPVPFAVCRDEQNRPMSHGGLVPILNEPGRMMRCEDGRWVEASVR